MFETYQEIFDQRGADYHRAMSAYPAARDAEFRNLIDLAQIGAGDVVCDMPAGGCYLRRYLDESVTLIAVETSAEFQRLCSESASNRQVLCDDLARVPLPDGSVTRVFSLAGLHHLADLSPVYREVNRLLAPGGLFCLADVYAGSGPGMFLNDFVHNHSSMGHVGLFLDDATLDELGDAGFRLDSARTMACPWRFSTVRDMTRFCRSLFGIDRADPETIFQGLQRHVGARETNACWELAWELFYIRAEKT